MMIIIMLMMLMLMLMMMRTIMIPSVFAMCPACLAPLRLAMPAGLLFVNIVIVIVIV